MECSISLKSAFSKECSSTKNFFSLRNENNHKRKKKKNFEPLKITNNISLPTQRFSRKNNHPVEPLL
jgi:hypothetical protein